MRDLETLTGADAGQEPSGLPDTRLAELNAQAAEWEHETRNPAYDLATIA